MKEKIVIISEDQDLLDVYGMFATRLGVDLSEVVEESHLALVDVDAVNDEGDLCSLGVNLVILFDGSVGETTRSFRQGVEIVRMPKLSEIDEIRNEVFAQTA